VQDIAPHKVIEQGAFTTFIRAIASEDDDGNIQLPLRIIEVLIADGDFLSSPLPLSLSIANLNTYRFW
jgi:hypothetical protein